ncbi:MAG: alpha/beta hydrolase [Acidimicrobiales bacterium]|jgi:dienelactone hydrolase
MKILEDESAGGVRRRGYVLEGDNYPVPGALWTPVDDSEASRDARPRPGGASGGARPLVLIGHGASGSKYQDYVVALAKSLVRDFAIAAAAIDGPVHGSRRGEGGDDPQQSFLDFAALWSNDPEMTDRMIADWHLALDSLSGFEDISGPVGYWGLSMGTILGLPFVAGEPRISAAVLGLMGVAGPRTARLLTDAANVSCPVLFLVQWSDELFPRKAAFDLFDALGSTDKTLHANPGTHGEVPVNEFAASARYLARRLRSPI